MSNLYQLPNKDKTLDEASEWLAELEKGLDHHKEIELGEWLNKDPINQEIFYDLAGMWDKMDSLSRLKDLFPLPVDRPVQKQFGAQVVFASVLLIAIFTSLFTLTDTFNFESELEHLTESKNDAEQLYTTNVGEKSTITLIDGSQLILNTNSSIKTMFTENERHIYLDRGEINVKVAHDKNRPFFVHAGDNIVEAIGTEFNLEIIDGQKIELIVTEGKVLVTVKERPSSDGAKVGDANKNVVINHNKLTITMVEGDKIILGSDDEKVERITAEDIKVNLSWRGGNLFFRGESLEKIIEEIERYTQVEFEILDEDLKRIRVAGLFKAGDVKGLLETLEKNFNVTNKKIGNNKILLSNHSGKTD